MGRAIINKLLHEPTACLRTSAHGADGQELAQTAARQPEGTVLYEAVRDSIPPMCYTLLLADPRLAHVVSGLVLFWPPKTGFSPENASAAPFSEGDALKAAGCSAWKRRESNPLRPCLELGSSSGIVNLLS